MRKVILFLNDVMLQSKYLQGKIAGVLKHQLKNLFTLVESESFPVGKSLFTCQSISVSFSYFKFLRKASMIVLITMLFNNKLFADYTINNGTSVDPAATPSLLNATGTIYIYGTMAINSDVTFTSSTPLKILIYGTNGQIYWYANKTLALPAGSTITYVNNPTAPPGMQPTSGPGASASKILQIGGVKYSSANDNSNNVVYSFDEINTIGGTAKVAPSSSTSSLCSNSPVSISANPVTPATDVYYVIWSSSSGSAVFADNNTNTAANTTVSGLSGGINSIICQLYSDAGGSNYYIVATDSFKINVNTPPTITGTLSFCSGSTTQLTGSGTPAASSPWLSGSTGVATTSNAGLITSVTAGSSVITYKDNNGCSTTATVTVNALPTITGTLSFCNGSTTQLTGSGTPAASSPWVSGSTAVATVSNTGLVTGVSAGTSVITYKNNNGCTITATVTVNALPTITGTLSFCNGSTTQLTGSGTPAASSPWLSGSTGVATTSNAGLITSVAAGSSVITYKDNNGCSTTATVTVNALPTITGTLSFCNGSTTQLTGSGTPAASSPWISASTAVAAINNTGLVTGVSAGTSVITYKNNNGCTITATVTVNALPTITGTLSFCNGSTTQLTGSGTPAASSPWLSGSTGVATTSNAGLITSVTAGSSVITYKDNNGCSTTATVTVNALPTITGTLSFCNGSTTQLTGSGTPAASSPWISASTAVATINNTGLVTSVSAGTSVITYKNNNGCTITATVTVNALPTITGTLSFCNGSTTQLTGSGTPAASSPWLSGSTGVATTSNAGLITSVTVGSSVITYKDNNGCSTTTTVTVNALPTITGTLSFCNGSTTQLTGSGTPAVSSPWISASTGVVTTSNTGLLTGIATGSSMITYKDNNGCTTTTNTTVNTTGTATIVYDGSPFCYNTGVANVTLSGTTGGSFSASPAGALINANNGKVNLASSDPGTYTVTYSLTATGCSVYNATTQVSINPNTWLGKASSNWDSLANWSGGFNNTCPDVTILGEVPYEPLLGSRTISLHNLIIKPGGSLTLNDAKLKVSGSITNSGIFDASNGTIEMNGSVAQTIAANSFFNNKLKNLIISNSSSAGVTLGGPLDLYGSLTYSGTGMTLTTNDSLTLKSTPSGTASVGVMTGNTIAGKVTVERYLPASTAWRFLSVPTNTSQTIRQTWQEGASTLGSNPVSGFGTQITGTGGTAAGFDAYSPSPAMKTYNSATNAWVGVPSTNATNIKNTSGYMVFVRGDRTSTSATRTTTSTVLRTQGNLYVDDQPSITVSVNKFVSIGNPYASAVDMRNISKTGIKDFFYLWDPKLSGGFGYGGYQTFSNDGSGNYVITPGGGSYATSGTISNYIQSGQAFFVQGNSSGGSLTFKEAAKAMGSNLVSTPATLPLPQLRVNLYGVNSDSSTYISDGFLINYGDDFSNVVDDLDAIKSSNSSENLSIKDAGTLLVVERKHTITSQDTVTFNLTNVSVKKYRFEILSDQLYQPGLTGYVVDNYLDKRTPLNIDGSTLIDFNIANIAVSYAANRFQIVFSQLGALPVSFTSVKAYPKDANVIIEWKVDNENNIKRYEVEKSIDGNQFITMFVMASPANNAGLANYQAVDTNPVPGYNYYRIKSVDENGQVAYSSIIKAEIKSVPGSDISIYPNPIENNTIRLHLPNQPSGTYFITIFNQLGQPILTKQIIHNQASTTEIITPGNNLAHGIYRAQVITPAGNIEQIQVKN